MMARGNLARLGLDRLGLSGRLVAIVLLTILTALILSAGLLYVATDRNKPTNASLPVQIAAIVELLETSTKAQQPLILRAHNGADFVLIIGPKPTLNSSLTRSLPAVGWMVSRQFDPTTSRQILAFQTDDYPGNLFSKLLSLTSPFSNTQMTIAVQLAAGNFAIFTTRGAPAARIFGLPPGFWIGALGVLLALIAVRAVMREAKPLSQLEASLAGFASDAAPRTVPPAGAPDLQRLIKATNDMQDQIAALIKGRTLLMASISHDLRSYLTRLRLRMEMLPGEPARLKAINDIDTMTKLLADAMAVSRAQIAVNQRKRVDLALLATDEITERADPRLKLELPTNNTAAILQGDPVALRRLIANLLDNAARYGTQVLLRIEAAPSELHLSIADDGPGIPSAQRDLIFEPFHIADPSRSRAAGGSGLGLAIVKQIATDHGALISVGTASLGGARFTVTFPLIPHASYEKLEKK